MLSCCALCPTPLIRRRQALKEDGSVSICSPLSRSLTSRRPPSFSSASKPSFLLSPSLLQRLDVLTSIYSMSPPDGGAWESGLGGVHLNPVTCVRMPDGPAVQVPVGGEQTAGELLHAACKVEHWLM